MKIIKPSIEIIDLDRQRILTNIEKAGRTAYKSEDKIMEDSASKFVEKIMKHNHQAMIEFGHIIVRVICDRGVSYELVRHRLFSFAQESTRYCNYSKDKFDNELTFIEPKFVNKNLVDEWLDRMYSAESSYLLLIENGATPQEARAVLPNSLKTEVVIGGNCRQWKHFFELRTAKDAHPQIQEVANMLLVVFQKKLPEIFGSEG